MSDQSNRPTRRPPPPSWPAVGEISALELREGASELEQMASRCLARAQDLRRIASNLDQDCEAL